jgi:hypothetical protein
VTVGRRSFLGLFAASPLAAKVAADKMIADAAGFAAGADVGLGGKADIIHFGGGLPSSDKASAPLTASQKATKTNWLLKRFGIPRWEEERIRIENRPVHYLDPDLAALKSFSMSVKIATQRERNIEREIARIGRQTSYNAQLEEFRDRHGFWFWW